VPKQQTSGSRLERWSKQLELVLRGAKGRRRL